MAMRPPRSRDAFLFLRSSTPPQGLLLTCVILMFIIVTFSISTVMIIPQYIAFGSQTITKNGEVSRVSLGVLLHHPCPFSQYDSTGRRGTAASACTAATRLRGWMPPNQQTPSPRSSS